MRIAERPIIYEINTAVFLHDLSEKYGKPVTLANVPAAEWDTLAKLPIDAVWLMGVWKRSPLGRQMALENNEYKIVLPDLKPEDVLGSAYCVYEYVVDEQFGGNRALAVARSALAKRGMALILDFVPNHTSLDNLWTKTHPEYYIQGTAADLKESPSSFYKTAGTVVVRGKDPNYEPWSDVAQLNAFSHPYRKAAIVTLKKISRQCDGVRCDMAMLMSNSVFSSTWGERVGSAPDSEYWPEVIEAVRSLSPDFLFLAEVYWDMQETLLAQGFDLCYDKDFFDIVRHGSAAQLYKHLELVQPIQGKLLRFLENHDEERAGNILNPLQKRALAVALTTIEGARLYLDGQLQGCTTRIPVQLNHGPKEHPDEQLQEFYEHLFEVFAKMNTKKG